MALLLYEGFDNWSASFILSPNLSGVTGTAGVGVWNLVVPGGITFPSSPAYGGRTMSVNNTSSWSYNVINTNTNALLCGFRWNSSSLSANVLTIYDSAGAVQCGLGISANKLFMWRGTTATVLGTGNTTINASSDNYIEIKTQLSNSANVTVKINGIVEFTLSGVDTTNTANQNWIAIGCSATPGGSAVVYDDLYLGDDSGSAPYNDLLGPVHVDTSFGTSAVRTQFTPLTSTNVSQIQETAVDGDTSYNVAPSYGAVDLFNHVSFLTSPATAVVSTPQTIFAAKVQSYARKDDVSNVLYRNKLVSSTGLITDGAVRGSGGLTMVYQLQEDYYTTDPATGLAWTVAGINSSGIGYEVLRSAPLLFNGAGSLTVLSTLWSPSVIDPAIWYKGDTLLGAGGSGISQWNDSSSHARNATQPTSNLQPTVDAAALNGMNVVFYTSGGVNQRVFILPNLNTAFGTTAGSLIFLIKATADPGGGDTGPQFIGTSTSGDLWPFTNGHIFNSAMSNSRRDCGDPAVSLATWHLGGIYSATNDFQVWINAVSFFTDVTNTVAWQSNPNLGAGGSFGWEGRMAEWVLVVPAVAPGGSVWQKIEGYIAWKWGVAASVLPIGHPYRNGPPLM